MAKQGDLLLQLVKGQAEIATTIETHNTRLFGAEGQKGAIPLLFEKLEQITREVQAVKDGAAKDVQELKDTEIAQCKDDIAEVKKDLSVTMWKTGSISSAAGAGLGIAASVFVKKFLGLHS